jgi:hypothetical protein
MRLRHSALALAGCLLLLGISASAQAQPAAEVAEPTVKAAFLYKFAAYVEWPPATFTLPEAPFVIGVSGAEDVAAALDAIVPGRTVHDRRVQVKRLRDGESPRGLHMVFVGRDDAASRALVRSAPAANVLVVTQSERGLEQGASINFVTSEGRVGFEVSLDSAEHAGLKISSRMLTVARRVVPRA